MVFDTERLSEIKEAITKSDIRALVDQGAISKVPTRGISRARINFAQQQKRKGKRKGHGSRKGSAGARTNKKMAWVNKVRLQRSYIKALRLKNVLQQSQFVELYKKVKGGFFRSKRHMELYLTEQGILKANKPSQLAESQQQRPQSSESRQQRQPLQDKTKVSGEDTSGEDTKVGGGER